MFKAGMILISLGLSGAIVILLSILTLTLIDQHKRPGGLRQDPGLLLFCGISYTLLIGVVLIVGSLIFNKAF